MITPHRISFCVALDRPELGHVQLSVGDIEGKGSAVYACATDGRRMCVAKLEGVAMDGWKKRVVEPDAKSWDEPASTGFEFPDWRKVARTSLYDRAWAFDTDLQSMIFALRRFVDHFNVAHARALEAWKERHAAAKLRTEGFEADLKAARGSDRLKRDDITLPKPAKQDLAVLRAARDEAEKNATEIWNAKPARDCPSLLFVPAGDGVKMRLVLEAPKWLLPNDELSENDLHVIDVGRMSMRVGSYQLPFGPKHAFCLNADFLLETLEQHRRDLKSSAGAVITISGGVNPLGAIIVDRIDEPNIFDIIMPRESARVSEKPAKRPRQRKKK